MYDDKYETTPMQKTENYLIFCDQRCFVLPFYSFTLFVELLFFHFLVVGILCGFLLGMIDRFSVSRPNIYPSGKQDFHPFE